MRCARWDMWRPLLLTAAWLTLARHTSERAGRRESPSRATRRIRTHLEEVRFTREFRCTPQPPQLVERGLGHVCANAYFAIL